MFLDTLDVLDFYGKFDLTPAPVVARSLFERRDKIPPRSSADAVSSHDRGIFLIFPHVRLLLPCPTGIRRKIEMGDAEVVEFLSQIPHGLSSVDCQVDCQFPWVNRVLLSTTHVYPKIRRIGLQFKLGEDLGGEKWTKLKLDLRFEEVSIDVRACTLTGLIASLQFLCPSVQGASTGHQCHQLLFRNQHSRSHGNLIRFFSSADNGTSEGESEGESGEMGRELAMSHDFRLKAGLRHDVPVCHWIDFLCAGGRIEDLRKEELEEEDLPGEERPVIRRALLVAFNRLKDCVNSTGDPTIIDEFEEMVKWYLGIEIPSGVDRVLLAGGTSLVSNLTQLEWTNLPYDLIHPVIEQSRVLRKLTLEGASLSDSRCVSAIAASKSLDSVALRQRFHRPLEGLNVLFSSESIRRLDLSTIDLKFDAELPKQDCLRILSVSGSKPYLEFIDLPSLREIGRKLDGLRELKLDSKNDAGAKTIIDCIVVEKGDKRDFSLVVGIRAVDRALEATLRGIPFRFTSLAWKSDGTTTADFTRLPYQTVLRILEFFSFRAKDNPQLFVREAYGRFSFDVTRSWKMVFASVNISHPLLFDAPGILRARHICSDSIGQGFIPPTRTCAFLETLEVPFHVVHSFEWLDFVPRLTHLKVKIESLDQVGSLQGHPFRSLCLNVSVVEEKSTPTKKLSLNLHLHCLSRLEILSTRYPNQPNKVSLSGLKLTCPKLRTLRLRGLNADDGFVLQHGGLLRNVTVEQCPTIDGYEFYRLLNPESLRTLRILCSHSSNDLIFLDRILWWHPSPAYRLVEVKIQNCSWTVSKILPMLSECPLELLSLTGCQGIEDSLVEIFQVNEWNPRIRVELDMVAGVTEDLVLQLKDSMRQAQIFWDGVRSFVN